MRTAYQPEFRNGKTLGSSLREALTRYQAIAPHILPRQSILDFGAHRGYFAHRLAAELDCSVMAVDPQAEPAPGVAVMRKKLSAPELRNLGRFDATLALSVLHHCDPWEEFLEAILASAPRVFIEIPHPRERLRTVPQSRCREIHDRLSGTGTVLCETGGVYQKELLRPLIMIDIPGFP
jgi:hypothetical protein